MNRFIVALYYLSNIYRKYLKHENIFDYMLSPTVYPNKLYSVSFRDNEAKMYLNALIFLLFSLYDFECCYQTIIRKFLITPLVKFTTASPK